MKDYAFPEGFLAQLYDNDLEAVATILCSSGEKWLVAKAVRVGDKLIWKKTVVPADEAKKCPKWLWAVADEEVPTKAQVALFVAERIAN